MRTVTTTEYERDKRDKLGQIVKEVVTVQTFERWELGNRDSLQLDGRAVYEALQRFKRINGGILNLT